MRQWILRSVRLAVVLAVVGAVVGCGGGGGSVLTLDRIGKEDAPNTMTLQLNASYTQQSPTPSCGKRLPFHRGHPSTGYTYGNNDSGSFPNS